MTRPEIKVLTDDLALRCTPEPERTDWFSVICILLIGAIVGGVVVANLASAGIYLNALLEAA